MAGTAKRLRPNDLQILEQFRQKRLQAFRHDSFVLTVYLSIILLSRVGAFFYKRVIPHTIWFNAYFTCMIVGFIGLYLALTPLCSLFTRLFQVHALPRVLQWQNILFLNLYLLVSIPITLLVITIWRPFRFLRTVYFGDITSECFCMVIVTCILLFLTRRVQPFPRFNQFIRQLIIGMTLAIFISFTLAVLMPFAGLSLSFDNRQLWQSGLLAIMLWPIFLLHEGVVHNWREKGTASAFLLSFSVRVCLLVIVYVSSTFSEADKFIVSIWPILVVAFLFLQHCCSLLYRKGRAAIAGATLSACTISWILTTHLTPLNLMNADNFIR